MALHNPPFSSNALNTALAALAGVAAATVVKLLLDEATKTEASRATAPARPHRPAGNPVSRQARLRELATAARDPLYLADMQEVNDDFAFADAEHI